MHIQYIFSILLCLNTARKLSNHCPETAYKNHGALAANKIACAWFEFFGFQAPELLLMAVRSHMGQWTENKDERPFTNIDRLVHLSDYIASRPFWDIPTLTAEYNEDAEV